MSSSAATHIFDSTGESDDEMDYTYEPGANEDEDGDDEEREGQEEAEQEEEEDDGRDRDPDEFDLDTMTVTHIARLLNSRAPFLFRINAGSRQPRLPECKDPVPNPVGRKLMQSGDFGADELEATSERTERTPLARRLLDREVGKYTGERARISNQLIAQSLLPDDTADFIIHYDNRAYSGQFSEDGNFFYSCAQDFKVRIYDTSNPYEWKYYKTADYYNGQWTITDSTLSPDNRFLAYSSITSTVYLTNTSPDMDEMHMLEFSADRRSNRHAMHRHYGIWSIRFSGDGSEIVAGSSDNCIYVYDIERKQPILKLDNHTQDVNAVCYGDRSSPHILFSGSDDTTIKVWDRRSMADGREVGVFPGHTEGVTYVDGKGDGRYVLSNGKDQTMRLWDLRNMMDTNKFAKLERKDYSVGFDYRTETYHHPPRRHPHDKSLVTYRGHSVHQTLIRCHFSPFTSTGSRYVYTGSADGKVTIYNLDATVAGTIDVYTATKNSRPLDESLLGSGYYHGWNHARVWKTCVRDVSWHPSAPVLAATSWNGYGYSTGTVSMHSWKGGKAAGLGVVDVARRYNPEMNEDSDLYDTEDEYEDAEEG